MGLASFILDFLSSLAVHSPATLQQLYGDPWAAHGVLRALPPLAKNFTMRMLYLTGPLAARSVLEWTPVESRYLARDALCKLYLLRMVLIKSEAGSSSLDEALAAGLSDPSGDEDALTAAVARALEDVYAPGALICLDPVFQASLQSALAGEAPTPWIADADPSSLDGADLPSAATLDSFAETKWEAILEFLMGTPSSDLEPGVEAMLAAAGLIVDHDSDETAAPVLTPAGFKYLLKDVYTQIWTLLVEFISVASEQENSMASVIRFLFVLTFLEVGQPYRMDALSEFEQTLVLDLHALGLIYLASPDSALGREYYFPTKLATHLMTGNIELEDDHKYIIVETNLHLYAYTTSVIKMNILSMFTAITCRLPNLVVGEITRSVVNSAFGRGITADEILQYLADHAHPKMSTLPSLLDTSTTLGDLALLSATSPLQSAAASVAATQKAMAAVSSDEAAIDRPADVREIATSYYFPLHEGITDQIKLWEQERNRIVFVPDVVVYSGFATKKAFNQIVQLATARGCLVYVTPAKRMLVVKESGAAAINATISGIDPNM
ncbi:general transcription factor II H [Thecamonas trahens ATCC 50062]|uniref:General transcription factor IIH subunit 4 n=1 Tax=Thecamonas trahens ATCC 50062 TaxID=461836 RepID=A0A0L0D3U9_THETB|nr:general transcription factor II H [Thecamonas trahens ATCC 50062]KNC47027.1 general transcription factor II H [Thecamonas trahens ATCC 50062]|eukprot:XP_013759807.1 general transcription factor II H [Thecamonas trahens ATCC 50062]